jgi:hypothetical protein
LFTVGQRAGSGGGTEVTRGCARVCTSISHLSTCVFVDVHMYTARARQAVSWPNIGASTLGRSMTVRPHTPIQLDTPRGDAPIIVHWRPCSHLNTYCIHFFALAVSALCSLSLMSRTLCWAPDAGSPPVSALRVPVFYDDTCPFVATVSPSDDRWHTDRYSSTTTI